SPATSVAVAATSVAVAVAVAPAPPAVAGPGRPRPPRTATPTMARNPSDGTRTTRQQQERGRRPAPPAEEEGVDPQHRAGGVDRLQGRQPAATVHVRAGEDPGAPSHRQLHAAAAPGGTCDPRGSRDGAPALQRAAGDPAQGWPTR